VVDLIFLFHKVLDYLPKVFLVYSYVSFSGCRCTQGRIK
jgi:hypothetical protein